MSAVATNRKALFNYQILEEVEAGLILTGTEVKSIRAGHVSLSDSYAVPKGSELYLINCHISPYDKAGYLNHEPLRERKLLLNAREMAKLIGKSYEKGLTIVPLKLYFKGAWAKVLLGVGKGKKFHDKRESIKRREADRESARAMRRDTK